MVEECVYIGQKAVYTGPFTSVTDDEGHVFVRGEPVEVCTDTAKKLSRDPYREHFVLTDPTQNGGKPCCEGGEPC